MYDPRIDTKSDAAKLSLLNVCRMLQNLDRQFELYWGPAQDFSIDEKTIGFQVRNKDKVHIMFKGAGGIFQADAVFDNGYIYYFIFCNDYIPDTKHYLCAASERLICILKCIKT